MRFWYLVSYLRHNNVANCLLEHAGTTSYNTAPICTYMHIQAHVLFWWRAEPCCSFNLVWSRQPSSFDSKKSILFRQQKWKLTAIKMKQSAAHLAGNSWNYINIQAVRAKGLFLQALLWWKSCLVFTSEPSSTVDPWQFRPAVAHPTKAVLKINGPSKIKDQSLATCWHLYFWNGAESHSICCQHVSIFTPEVWNLSVASQWSSQGYMAYARTRRRFKTPVVGSIPKISWKLGSCWGGLRVIMIKIHFWGELSTWIIMEVHWTLTFGQVRIQRCLVCLRSSFGLHHGSLDVQMEGSSDMLGKLRKTRIKFFTDCYLQNFPKTFNFFWFTKKINGNVWFLQTVRSLRRGSCPWSTRSPERQGVIGTH